MSQLLGVGHSKALFSWRNEKFSVTVAFLFVCGKYYLIID